MKRIFCGLGIGGGWPSRDVGFDKREQIGAAVQFEGRNVPIGLLHGAKEVGRCVQADEFVALVAEGGGELAFAAAEVEDSVFQVIKSDKGDSNKTT